MSGSGLVNGCNNMMKILINKKCTAISVLHSNGGFNEVFIQ